MREQCSMQVPDFSRVQLSPRVLTHEVSDEEIFRQPLAKATMIVPAQGGAQDGDFVRIHLCGADREMQLVLGSGIAPEMEAALQGTAAGMQIETCGEALAVLSVKRKIVPQLGDALIAALNIPGVATADAYRHMYINENRDSMLSMVLLRLNAGIMAQLKKDVVPDEAEVQKRYEISRANILKRQGGEEGYIHQLIDILSLPENATLSQCDEGLLSICRERMVETTLGQALAARDGKEWNDTTRREHLNLLAKLHDSTPEQVMTWACDMALMDGYYNDYLANCIEAYFKPKVNIMVNGEVM